MAEYPQVSKVILIFLSTGAMFGLIFGWLTRWEPMTDFWYLRGDKFLTPTYKYWLAGSLSFSLGIWTGYSLSRVTALRIRARSIPPIRLLGAIILMVTTAPILAFIHDTMGNGPWFFWDFFVLPFAAIASIPIALKLCTRRWEVLLTALMFAAVLLSVFGGYFVGATLEPQGRPPDLLFILQMSIEEGLVAAFAGIWLFPNYKHLRGDHNTDVE